MSRIGIPPAALRPLVRALASWSFSPRVDWDTSRRRMERSLALLPLRGVAVTETLLGGVSCEELRLRDGGDDPVLLYLHGGGYVIGSPRGYRALVASIGKVLGGRALVPGYRLAPEHPHPAALQDARAVWLALTGPNGVPPQRVVVVGDSAGGGLALALSLSLRDESPWVASEMCR